jgi:hypothetical protein
LGHNGIDLASFINRRIDLQEYIEGQSKETKTMRKRLLDKAYKEKIKTLDDFTAPIIILH